MSRDKLLHCKKKVKHRGSCLTATFLVAAMLAGCSWVEGDEPPPAEGDGEFPNLASVPDRPDRSVFEEASLLEAGLRADRENARYDEAPLAPSTAAGVAPPPPSPVAPAVSAVPTVSAAPVVTTATRPVVAALPPEAMPPAVAAPPTTVEPSPVAAPPAPVEPAAETVATYSVDTPIAPTTANVPPPPSPVQVITRPTPVVPEPTALAAVPPPPYGSVQPSPYQAVPGQGVPGQYGTGSTGAPQPPAGAQVSAINPMALSRNLVAGSVLPASVVYFGNGSSAVSSAEAAKLYQVAQVHAGRGGYLRIVGHSSMRTGNMDRARQYQANLEVSWARANAVADVLMRYGVPANAMMVSAVSDSRPIYMENMPAGEAGNRRVEIYLE